MKPHFLIMAQTSTMTATIFGVQEGLSRNANKDRYHSGWTCGTEVKLPLGPPASWIGVLACGFQLWFPVAASC